MPMMCYNYLKPGFHMIVFVAWNALPVASKRMKHNSDDSYLFCFLNGRFCRYTAQRDWFYYPNFARSIYKFKMAAVNEVLFGIKRSFAKQERNAGGTDFGLEPYFEIFMCGMAHSSSFSKKSVARSNVSVFPFGLFRAHSECLSQFGTTVLSALNVFVVLSEISCRGTQNVELLWSFCSCDHVQNKLTTWKGILRYILSSLSYESSVVVFICRISTSSGRLYRRDILECHKSVSI